MKIEYLNYLLEIEKCKSISAAAKKLYIGQTTLSAIIKSIEEELDTRLFHRLPSGVAPTEKGVQVLRYAEEIVEGYRQMLSYCKVDSHMECHIHFLGDTTTCAFLSVYLMKTLHGVNTNALESIVFHEVERKRLVTSIVDGIANIGVTSLDPRVEVEPSIAQAKRSGIEVTKLGIDRFYLCVRSDSKYAEQTLVDINSLLNEPYIAPQHYSAVPNGTAFGDALRQLNCIGILPGVGYVKQAIVECRDTIAILTGRNLINDPYILHGQLKAIPLTGFGVPNATSIFLFTRKKSSLTSFEKNLCDALIEYSKIALLPEDCADETVEPYPPLLMPGVEEIPLL